MWRQNSDALCMCVCVRVVKICELMVPSPCRCGGTECRPLAQFAIMGCALNCRSSSRSRFPQSVGQNQQDWNVCHHYIHVGLSLGICTDGTHLFFLCFRWVRSHASGGQWRRWGRVQEDRGWVRRTNVFVMHLFISETNTSKVTSKEQLLYHCRLSNFVREGRQNWIKPSIWNNRNWSFDFWYFKAASMYDESNTYLCLEEEEFNQDSTELSVVQQK